MRRRVLGHPVCGVPDSAIHRLTRDVMRESLLQRDVRIALGKADGVAAWRNNVGQAEFVSPQGLVQRVSYGLCVGSSDIIAVVSVVITPEMVGKTMGRFTAIELKAPGARTEKKRAEQQQMFRNLVNRLGGFAEVLNDASALDGLLEKARNL
jgi:hypothetical protein